MAPAAGLRLEPAFATPIIVGYLPESAELAEALEPIILERRSAAAGMVRSNVGGWHSDTNMLSWGGEPMRRLVERVVTLADANVEDLEEPARGRRGWILEAWANINEPGASNAAHAHPGCFWSAVFYVRAGEGEGGEILFHDPRLPFLNMHAPALRFRDFGPEGELALRPETGMLLLFPAWLSHGVQPWAGEGLRISVAINLSARQRHAGVQ
jgi:uncharacterized protein (TIGR02466 family)